MTLGLRLRRARKHAKLTQKELESASGVSQKTISKIERGAQGSSSAIVQLASACGVRPQWLATNDQPMIEPSAPPRLAQRPPQYAALSDEAIDLARAWMSLPPERRECVRVQIFIEAVATSLHPYLRSGRPAAKAYADFEKSVQADYDRECVRRLKTED